MKENLPLIIAAFIYIIISIIHIIVVYYIAVKKYKKEHPNSLYLIERDFKEWMENSIFSYFIIFGSMFWPIALLIYIEMGIVEFIIEPIFTKIRKLNGFDS